MDGTWLYRADADRRQRGLAGDGAVSIKEVRGRIEQRWTIGSSWAGSPAGNGRRATTVCLCYRDVGFIAAISEHICRTCTGYGSRQTAGYGHA